MATRLVIEGGAPLRGEVPVSAAKNAALPDLCAALLTAQPVVLENVPALADVTTTRSLLEGLGGVISTDADGGTRVQVSAVSSNEAPYELVSTMRASVLVLGPLLARTGLAKVALPGGCAIGVRPIDQHLKGFQKLGAEVFIRNGYVEARASRLKGARITTDLVTVTGTENLMMAAALAEGTTVIENAAREPEVSDLARLLSAMGARIDGAGTERIEIEGVTELGGARHRVIPDRIEAGTLLVGAAITGGDVTITGAEPRHLSAVLSKLEECGAAVTVAGDRIRCQGPARARPAHQINSPVPRQPHRHAGAVHGDAGAGRRDQQDLGDDLREPVHARGRAVSHGRAHRGRRVHRRGPRAALLSRRAGDGHGSARVGLAGAGRAGRPRPDGGLARLSSGPWLRAARGQAALARRGDRAGALMLTLALPKGRLLDPALARLAGMGIRGIEPASRRLLLTDEQAGLRFILLKPADIPTYVEYGAADLGIVGKDILLEQQPDVYEPVDLGFGFCRLVVAEPRELWERDDPARWSWVRVATKYPRLTESYFSERGIQVEMVRLDGSIELAPLVGLAERIVDLVQSGETLRANGLVEVAEILTSTARLIVNRASLKTAHSHVSQLIAAMRQAVSGRAERTRE
jgi:UDP-N-acetylglucosamine 1-carboxyvinyltransferase/ATP phosphoribosyltransferase